MANIKGITVVTQSNVPNTVTLSTASTGASKPPRYQLIQATVNGIPKTLLLPIGMTPPPRTTATTTPAIKKVIRLVSSTPRAPNIQNMSPLLTYNNVSPPGTRIVNSGTPTRVVRMLSPQVGQQVVSSSVGTVPVISGPHSSLTLPSGGRLFIPSSVISTSGASAPRMISNNILQPGVKLVTPTAQPRSPAKSILRTTLLSASKEQDQPWYKKAISTLLTDSTNTTTQLSTSARGPEPSSPNEVCDNNSDNSDDLGLKIGSVFSLTGDAASIAPDAPPLTTSQAHLEPNKSEDDDRSSSSTDTANEMSSVVDRLAEFSNDCRTSEIESTESGLYKTTFEDDENIKEAQELAYELQINLDIKEHLVENEDSEENTVPDLSHLLSQGERDGRDIVVQDAPGMIQGFSKGIEFRFREVIAGECTKASDECDLQQREAMLDDKLREIFPDMIMPGAITKKDGGAKTHTARKSCSGKLGLNKEHPVMSSTTSDCTDIKATDVTDIDNKPSVLNQEHHESKGNIHTDQYATEQGLNVKISSPEKEENCPSIDKDNECKIRDTSNILDTDVGAEESKACLDHQPLTLDKETGPAPEKPNEEQEEDVKAPQKSEERMKPKAKDQEEGLDTEENRIRPPKEERMDPKDEPDQGTRTSETAELQLSPRSPEPVGNTEPSCPSAEDSTPSPSATDLSAPVETSKLIPPLSPTQPVTTGLKSLETDPEPSLTNFVSLQDVNNEPSPIINTPEASTPVKTTDSLTPEKTTDLSTHEKPTESSNIEETPEISSVTNTESPLCVKSTDSSVDLKSSEMLTCPGDLSSLPHSPQTLSAKELSPIKSCGDLSASLDSSQTVTADLSSSSLDTSRTLSAEESLLCSNSGESPTHAEESSTKSRTLQLDEAPEKTVSATELSPSLTATELSPSKIPADTLTSKNDSDFLPSLINTKSPASCSEKESETTDPTSEADTCLSQKDERSNTSDGSKVSGDGALLYKVNTNNLLNIFDTKGQGTPGGIIVDLRNVEKPEVSQNDSDDFVVQVSGEFFVNLTPPVFTSAPFSPLLSDSSEGQRHSPTDQISDTVPDVHSDVTSQSDQHTLESNLEESLPMENQVDYNPSIQENQHDHTETPVNFDELNENGHGLLNDLIKIKPLGPEDESTLDGEPMALKITSVISLKESPQSLNTESVKPLRPLSMKPQPFLTQPFQIQPLNAQMLSLDPQPMYSPKDMPDEDTDKSTLAPLTVKDILAGKRRPKKLRTVRNLLEAQRCDLGAPVNDQNLPNPTYTCIPRRRGRGRGNYLFRQHDNQPENNQSPPEEMRLPNSPGDNSVQAFPSTSSPIRQRGRGRGRGRPRCKTIDRMLAEREDTLGANINDSINTFPFKRKRGRPRGARTSQRSRDLELKKLANMQMKNNIKVRQTLNSLSSLNVDDLFGGDPGVGTSTEENTSNKITDNIKAEADPSEKPSAENTSETKDNITSGLNNQEAMETKTACKVEDTNDGVQVKTETRQDDDTEHVIDSGIDTPETSTRKRRGRSKSSATDIVSQISEPQEFAISKSEIKCVSDTDEVENLMCQGSINNQIEFEQPRGRPPKLNKLIIRKQVVNAEPGSGGDTVAYTKYSVSISERTKRKKRNKKTLLDDEDESHPSSCASDEENPTNVSNKDELEHPDETKESQVDCPTKSRDQALSPAIQKRLRGRPRKVSKVMKNSVICCTDPAKTEMYDSAEERTCDGKMSELELCVKDNDSLVTGRPESGQDSGVEKITETLKRPSDSDISLKKCDEQNSSSSIGSTQGSLHGKDQSSAADALQCTSDLKRAHPFTSTRIVGGKRLRGRPLKDQKVNDLSVNSRQKKCKPIDDIELKEVPSVVPSEHEPLRNEEEGVSESNSSFWEDSEHEFKTGENGDVLSSNTSVVRVGTDKDSSGLLAEMEVSGLPDFDLNTSSKEKNGSSGISEPTSNSTPSVHSSMGRINRLKEMLRKQEQELAAVRKEREESRKVLEHMDI